MRIGIGTVAAVAASLMFAPHAAAQDPAAGHEMGHDEHMEMPTEGVRAAVIHDITAAEEKIMALAGAMEDHWGWRPGEGVRSVGEVYGHIAATNMMIPMLFGVMPPPAFRGEDQQATMGKLMGMEAMSHEELMEHLGHSFMHARHAVARVPDDRLDETIQYFGQEGPLTQVLVLFVTHMHEHLGQSIAYARTNGVVPPWSQGGM